MKPILFSAPLVQALLNTKPGVWPAKPIDPSKPFKSQTRRVMKPQPVLDGRFWELGEAMWGNTVTSVTPMPCHSLYNRMPHKPGDILYVRETWTSDREGNYIYRADPIFDQCGPGDFGWEWSPSIHMPREAARLFLEVKAVRLERLQEITEADAIAEGSFLDRCVCRPRKNDKDWFDKLFQQTACYIIHGDEFKCLWNNLNAKSGYSWDSNPWVWVYEFMRLKEKNNE